MSAKHAVITCEVKDAKASPPEFEIKIIDLSRNGVMLNGERINKDEYYELKDGDAVTMPFHLEYRFELNPDGTLPRATRVPVDETPTPLQKKRASPATSAVENGGGAKKPRESCDDNEGQGQAMRELTTENGELRQRVEALEKELEEARRREKEAAAPTEAAEGDNDDVRAEALREAEEKVKQAEARAEKLNAELEEAQAVVEGAASATKEMETKLAELQSALDAAETKRVEAIASVQKECAEEIENLNARVARIQSVRKEELEEAEARVKAFASSARESRDLAKQLLDKLNESVQLVASDADAAHGDDDEMTHETTPQRRDGSDEKAAEDAAEDEPAKDDDDDINDNDDDDDINDKDDDSLEQLDVDNHFSDSILADVEFPPTEKPTQVAAPLHDIGNSPRTDQPSPSKRVGRDIDDRSPLPASVLED